MTDPARAERLWLIAIATWWLLAVGGEAEAAIPIATFPSVPGSPRPQGRCWRLVGVFRHGWSLIGRTLQSSAVTSRPRLPGTWPAPSMSPDILSLPMLEDET